MTNNEMTRVFTIGTLHANEINDHLLANILGEKIKLVSLQVLPCDLTSVVEL